VLMGGIFECLWLGDNDVTFSMAKRAYQNFNIDNFIFHDICLDIIPFSMFHLGF
jgi:hypothetical protein